VISDCNCTLFFSEINQTKKNWLKKWPAISKVRNETRLKYSDRLIQPARPICPKFPDVPLDLDRWCWCEKNMLRWLVEIDKVRKKWKLKFNQYAVKRRLEGVDKKIKYIIITMLTASDTQRTQFNIYFKFDSTNTERVNLFSTRALMEQRTNDEVSLAQQETKESSFGKYFICKIIKLYPISEVSIILQCTVYIRGYFYRYALYNSRFIYYLLTYTMSIFLLNWKRRTTPLCHRRVPRWKKSRRPKVRSNLFMDFAALGIMLWICQHTFRIKTRQLAKYLHSPHMIVGYKKYNLAKIN